jgi:hypothetical protein
MPRTKRHGLPSSANFASLEALEPRALLAADLTAAIDSAKLPAETISGDGTKITVPVIITNAGPDALPAGSVADIRLSLRPADAADSSQDIELLTIEDKPLGTLKAGKTKKVTSKVLLPAGVDTGNYVIVAEVDTGAQVAESDDSNNAATSNPIAVTEGFVNLTATLVSETLPTAITEGDSVKAVVVVNVNNAGNIALPKGQTIALRLVADPTGEGEDVELATIPNQSISKLKPGLAKKVTFKLNATPAIEGEHQIKVVVDTGNAVAESNEGDNTLTLPDALTASPYTSILGGDRGNIFKFKKTGGQSIGAGEFRTVSENGTFTDEFGRTGTYSYNWLSTIEPNGGILQLVYDAEQGITTQVRFVNFQSQNAPALGGKTVRFAVMGSLNNRMGVTPGENFEFGVN